MKSASITTVLGGIFGFTGVLSLFDSDVGLFSLAAMTTLFSLTLFGFGVRDGEFGNFFRDLFAAEGKLKHLPFLSSFVVFLIPMILVLANPFPGELFYHFVIVSITFVVSSLAVKVFLQGSLWTLIPIPFSVVGIFLSVCFTGESENMFGLYLLFVYGLALCCYWKSGNGKKKIGSGQKPLKS